MSASAEQRDILEVAPDLAQFDYIIAYGVYSWVPPAVQEKILEVCGTLLSPQGVTCVSYNTFPGWRMNGMVREIVLFHLRNLKDPAERIRQAYAALDFLAKAIPDSLGLYRRVFTTMLERLAEEASRPTRLYHDYLEDVNDPVYFQQFAGHAARHRLRFVAEAEVSSMQADGIGPQAARSLDQLGHDLLEREQYIDFLVNRTFRQSRS